METENECKHEDDPMAAFMQAMGLGLKEDKTKANDKHKQSSPAPQPIKLKNTGSPVVEGRVASSRRCYKCCVPGCRSTDASMDKKGNPLAFFEPPKARKIVQKWINAIPELQSTSLSMFRRVCALHFVDGYPSPESPVPSLNLLDPALKISSKKKKKSQKTTTPQDSPKCVRSPKSLKKSKNSEKLDDEMGSGGSGGVDGQSVQSSLDINTECGNEDESSKKESPKSLFESLGYDTNPSLIKQSAGPLETEPAKNEIFGDCESPLPPCEPSFDAPNVIRNSQAVPQHHFPNILRKNGAPRKKPGPKAKEGGEVLCGRCVQSLPQVKNNIAFLETKVTSMITMMNTVIKQQKTIKNAKKKIQRNSITVIPKERHANPVYPYAYNPYNVDRPIIWNSKPTYMQETEAPFHKVIMPNGQVVESSALGIPYESSRRVALPHHEFRAKITKRNFVNPAHTLLKKTAPTSQFDPFKPQGMRVTDNPQSFASGSKEDSTKNPPLSNKMKSPELLSKYRLVKVPLPEGNKFILKPLPKTDTDNASVAASSPTVSKQSPADKQKATSTSILQDPKPFIKPVNTSSKKIPIKQIATGEGFNKWLTIQMADPNVKSGWQKHGIDVERKQAARESPIEAILEVERKQAGRDSPIEAIVEVETTVSDKVVGEVASDNHETSSVTASVQPTLASTRSQRIRKRKSDDMFVTTTTKKRRRKTIATGSLAGVDEKASPKKEQVDEQKNETVAKPQSPPKEVHAKTELKFADEKQKESPTQNKKDYLMNAVARVMLMFPGRGFTLRFLLQFGPIWLHKFPKYKLKEVIDDLVNQGLLKYIGPTDLGDAHLEPSPAYSKIDYDRMRTNPILKTSIRNFGCSVDGYKNSFKIGSADKKLQILDSSIAKAMDNNKSI